MPEYAPEIEMPSRLAQFTNAIEPLCHEVKNFGYPVCASTAEHLELFESKSDSEKDAVINHLRNWQATIEEAKRLGIDLRDDQALLQVAAEKMGIWLPRYTASCISKDDVVEIWDRHNVQIYRSFTFFTQSDYTLADLVLRPLKELYQRSAYIQTLLEEVDDRLLSGKENFITAKDVIPSHTMTEAMTLQRRSYLVNYQHYIRLVDRDGNPLVLATRRTERL